MVVEATVSEARTLELINITMASLSFLGSSFIMFCYFNFKDLRTFAFQLVFFVSCSDFILSIGNFLGDAGGQDSHLGSSDGLCTLQSIFISYGQLSSVLWSGAIAFTLHQAFLNRREDFSGQRISKYTYWYVGVCFGLPLIVTFLPFATDSYGDTGGWCWIVQFNEAGTLWRLLQFYIPLWFVVAYNTYVYVSVYQRLRDMDAARPNPQAAAMMSKIKYYPLVLVVCEFWASVNAIYEAVNGLRSGEQFVMWLNVLQITFASSIGMVNALVYGLTPNVYLEIRKMCSGEPNKTESLEEADEAPQKTSI